MNDSITKTEMEAARSSLKENAMIKILEVTIRGPDFPAECAQRLLIQIYWDVQSSRSIFQANQKGHLVFPRKCVNYASEQCSVTVCTTI